MDMGKSITKGENKMKIHGVKSIRRNDNGWILGFEDREDMYVSDSKVVDIKLVDDIAYLIFNN